MKRDRRGDTENTEWFTVTLGITWLKNIYSNDLGQVSNKKSPLLLKSPSTN